MRRSELIEAVAEILKAGPARARVIVVVQVLDARGREHGKVGLFGDVEDGATAASMLLQAGRWVERNGGPVDSYRVLRAMLAPPSGEPN